MSDVALELFVEICNGAIPIALTFAFGNLICSTFLRMAFGGKVWFGTK